MMLHSTEVCVCLDVSEEQGDTKKSPLAPN